MDVVISDKLIKLDGYEEKIIDQQISILLLLFFNKKKIFANNKRILALNRMILLKALLHTPLLCAVNICVISLHNLKFFQHFVAEVAFLLYSISLLC